MATTKQQLSRAGVAKNLAQAKLDAHMHDKPLLEEAVEALNDPAVAKALEKVTDLTSQLIAQDTTAIVQIVTMHTNLQAMIDNVRGALKANDAAIGRARIDLNMADKVTGE